VPRLDQVHVRVGYAFGAAPVAQSDPSGGHVHQFIGAFESRATSPAVMKARM